MFRKFLALFAFAHLLAACSALVPPPAMKAPTIGLSGLSVKDVGLSEVRFLATVSAENQNSYTMPLSDTRLELFLMGESFATGNTQSSKFELPAGQTTQVPVEFTVSTSKILNLLRSVGRGNWSQLSYQLKGDAKWGALGLPVSFDKKGDLEALKRLTDLIR